MPPRHLSDWPAVGARVTQARRALSLTQEQLGATVGLGRTAIAKIEGGNRTLSALELAQLAQATDLPIDWFVTESPPVVASHRSADPSMTHLVDLRVEALTREVMQLLEADLLKPAEGGIRLALPRNIAGAERAAMAVREHVGLDEEAFIDLGAAAEKLSLFAYSLALPGSQADGAYVAVGEQAGVALINGVHPPGRRRFTLAHEIGHHVFQDEYAIDQDLDTDTERLINAFAIHLLLPRAGLLRRWDALSGPDDPVTATAPAPFSDDPIVPGATPIRAVHFAELRARTDAVRRGLGLAPFPWTNPVLRAGTTPVRLAHLLELREALAAAYAASGRAAPRWNDPLPSTGRTRIRAVHLTELRAGVVALE